MMNNLNNSIETVEKIIKDNDIKEFEFVTEVVIGDKIFNVAVEYKFKKEVSKIAEPPICRDCLCRVCKHNVCGEGSDTREGCCEGCNNCNGVVDTEEDCVRSMYEYAGD